MEDVKQAILDAQGLQPELRKLLVELIEATQAELATKADVV